MSQWIVHRDPRWYDEPLSFQPDRWANGLASRLPKYAYFPFGGGPRLCIGNTFAMFEAPLILAMTARRHRLSLATPNEIWPRRLPVDAGTRKGKLEAYSLRKLYSALDEHYCRIPARLDHAPPHLLIPR